MEIKFANGTMDKKYCLYIFYYTRWSVVSLTLETYDIEGCVRWCGILPGSPPHLLAITSLLKSPWFLDSWCQIILRHQR